jgi:tetratricopeptide (TPR) repeat protein
MLQRLSAAVLLGSLLALSANAKAESATAVSERPLRAPEQRRDPKGVKGISPFFEALKRGDSALRARDFEVAIVAYRDAISSDPENALGLYRLGEAQNLKGDLHEAEIALSTGLRVVDAKNPSLKAKLLFALADLRERQKAYDQASAQWAEYEALTTGQKEAQGFPASGSERKKVVEAWQRLSAESLEVKARSEKGLKAAEEAVKKSSK